MKVFRPALASAEDMTKFHSDEYIEFLRLITPDNQHEHMRQLKRFNCAEDCPVFDGLFNFCQIYTGGSVGGAVQLNHKKTDTVINWAGGLHHAKKNEASGFCYVNDIVLAILELLKHHARVVYIDIDIHHGDGVEEAFYMTDRVMCVSFHKYGDLFFPGTGGLNDIGKNQGKYYSVNVPLRDGIHDDGFQDIFQTVMSKVMETYRPGAIVLQCGADSLAADRLGCFNLSLDGHADCVKFMKKFGVPLLVTGGGGYTKSNVSRCWTNETAVLLDRKLPKDIPEHDFYYEYYADQDYKLKVEPTNYIENLNNKTYMHEVKKEVLENLRAIEHAPGVAMHEVPPDSMIPEFDEDDLNYDERYGGQFGLDKIVDRDDEYYDGDKDQDH